MMRTYAHMALSLYIAFLGGFNLLKYVVIYHKYYGRY